MSRFSRLCLAVLLVLAVSLGGLGVVQAARGAPGSLEFGIGTAFYPGGTYPDQALQLAEDLAPDWVYVPVSWAAYQADPAAAPRFEALDAVFQMAERNQIAVAVSIVDAPGWAQTGQGPQAGETVKFVTALSQRYPRTLQAVELFPRANTQAAWGAPADPLAYFDLFRQVDASLRASGSTLTLVAAGLQPLATHPLAGDMDDLLFLKGLYAAGAREWMPVISLQFVELVGDPLRFPDGGDARVLRHYEDVRKIMVENNHRFGVIWITLICSPSGKIEASGVTIEDDELQVSWMTQIYVQARSQLYLGVIIGQSLNSEREGTAEEVSSMLQGAGLVHPFYAVLKEMISLNKAGSFTIKPGRPKEGNFPKHRP